MGVGVVLILVVVDTVNYKENSDCWPVVAKEGAKVNWRLGEIGKNGIPGSTRPGSS